MPGQTSVNYHTDEWYGHGHDVQNFWLPLTPVAETNSLYVSDEQTSLGVTETIRTVRHSIQEMNQLARRACRPLNMRFGEVYHFNSHIIHGTEKNNTDQTRVSFDFRMLREGDDRGLKDVIYFVPFGKEASFAGHRPANRYCLHRQTTRFHKHNLAEIPIASLQAICR